MAGGGRECRLARAGRRVGVAVLSGLLALSGCLAPTLIDPEEPIAEDGPELLSLSDTLEPLRLAFNSDRARGRLVVLLSPT